MGRPVAQGLRSLHRRSNLRPILQLAGHNGKGSQMNCAKYVRYKLNTSPVQELTYSHTSPQDWLDSFRIWLLIPRVRTLSLPRRCTLFSSISHPSFFSAEARMYCSRTETASPFCYILAQPCPHHSCQICAVRCPQEERAHPRH